MLGAEACLDRLLESRIIPEGQGERAKAVIAGLGSDETSWESVAEALFNEKCLTKFQFELVRRNRLGELIYGPYVIEESLGKGGMGQVFKACHKELRRVDALKMIQAEELQKQPELLGRFRREAELLAKIVDPHVVRAYHADYDHFNNRHYLAMEYVEGLDLQTLVDDLREKWRRLSFKDACRYVIHAALGLAKIHEVGIVHRDIKPSNLILATGGDVKVLDMGLARMVQSDNESPLTKTGQVLGSFPYMSPEQCQNSKDVGPASDIYSLGCVLYFLCVGQTIFEESCKGNIGAYAYAHIHRPAPSLRLARPDAPEQLDAIYRKMVAKASEDRFSNAEEVVKALRSLALSARQGRIPPSFMVGPPLSGVNPPVASEASQEWENNGLDMKMIWSPPGRFLMGAEQVVVELTQGFWIGKHQVTQAEYQRIMGENPSWFSNQGRGKTKVSGMDTAHFPVESVSWKDAMEFCRRFTEQEHQAGRLARNWEYSLPTEAQWEYACRASSANSTPYGDKLSSKLHANFDGSGNFEPCLDRTAKVGSYQANPWGLHDMLGNVWEWCLDEYQETLPGGVDPWTPGENNTGRRAYRGGCWGAPASYCQPTYRYRDSITYRQNTLGFRIVAVP